MKAMIFAAGLGTRLKPLTDNLPKALIKVNGIPMIERVINHLKSFGINEFVVNVHHFSEKIFQFFQEKHYFDCKIQFSDESSELLDTGGGLLKAADYFKKEEFFIAQNADVISNIDLNELLKVHLSFDSLVTLAVRKRQSNRFFLFNADMQLCGWQNTKTKEEKIMRYSEMYYPYAFSGIQIINSKIFNLISEKGKFSLTPLYLRLSENNNIIGFHHANDYWFDLGKIENIKDAERILQS